jgi:hypothetical protein
MLKGEPENDSRKPRDPPKNRHSESLKKSQLTLFLGLFNKEMSMMILMMMR